MMLQPAYKLTLGDKIIDTTDEPQASTVIDLTVMLDMETPADTTTLIMGQVGTFRPEHDDDVVVELGFVDGELTQVMQGSVVGTEPSLTSRQVIAYSAADLLLHSYVDQTFEDQDAAAIVTNLADVAGVPVANAQSGDQYPAYVIDGRRSVYHHMHDLAALAGYDLYLNADGELVFEKFVSGKTLHSFTYGEHIVELSLSQTNPITGEIQAWGESPVGGQSSQDWAWLTKDFDGAKGVAGGGKPTLLLERPALRTRDLAQTAAAALDTRIQRRTIRGHLLSTGQPLVKLGDAIRVQGAPEEEHNATYQVRSVQHRIHKVEGFTTRIGIRSIETGGPFGGLL